MNTALAVAVRCWGRGPPNRGYTPPSLAPLPNSAVLLPHCDQLIFFRKISKFDATRYQILRLKCTKFDFRWTAPRPHWGSLRSPDPLAVFKGPTSNGRVGTGRGGKEKKREVEMKRKGSEGREMEGPAPPPKCFGLEPPLRLSVA